MIPTGYYKEKVCIVTGANSGIGYALSEELMRRGAIVYMAGRDPKKVSDAAKKLSMFTDQIHTHVIDVTNQEQVQKAIEATATEAGRLDMLFNNAGIGGTMPFEWGSLNDWKTILETNLWSVIYGVHAAVPVMLKQGYGHIVNTSSISGIVPAPFQSLYNTSKYAVTGLTETLRYEYAEIGLYFSVICPALVATAIFNKGIDGKPHGELKVPADAFPADKTARYALDQVAEKKGIIVVPDEWETTGVWRGYVNGDNKADEFLRTMAHERRAEYQKSVR